jgi:hypothetical protein
MYNMERYCTSLYCFQYNTDELLLYEIVCPLWASNWMVRFIVFNVTFNNNSVILALYNNLLVWIQNHDTCPNMENIRYEDWLQNQDKFATQCTIVQEMLFFSYDVFFWIFALGFFYSRMEQKWMGTDCPRINNYI